MSWDLDENASPRSMPLHRALEADPPSDAELAAGLAAVLRLVLGRLDAARLLEDDRPEGAVAALERVGAGGDPAALKEALDEMSAEKQEREARDGAWFGVHRARAEERSRRRGPRRPPPPTPEESDAFRRGADERRMRSAAMASVRSALEVFVKPVLPRTDEIAWIALGSAASALRAIDYPDGGDSAADTQRIQAEADTQVEQTFLAALRAARAARYSPASAAALRRALGR